MSAFIILLLTEADSMDGDSMFSNETKKVSKPVYNMTTIKMILIRFKHLELIGSNYFSVRISSNIR